MQTIRLGGSQRPVWLAAGALFIAAIGVAAVPMLDGGDADPVAGAKPGATGSAGATAQTPARAVAPRHQPATNPAAGQAGACADCATVLAVRTVETDGQATGLGGVAGGVIGAALGNQVGKGTGRTAARVVGAVGGAVVGHPAEKQMRRHTHHEVQVRLSDGRLRTLRYEELPPFRAGDSVRLDGDRLIAA